MQEILEKVEYVLATTAVITLIPGGLLVSLFSQTVHRKFMKNTELRAHMGETGSGYVDVLIFTGMFGLPVSITRWLYRRNPFHFISNPDVILPHTTRYDRVVGFLAYWTFRCAMNCAILAVICEIIRTTFFV